MDNHNQTSLNTNHSRLMLAMAFLEGMAALILVFGIPSKGENAFFLGFSSLRWMLGALLAMVLLGIGIILLLSFFRKTWFEQKLSIICQYLADARTLLITSIILAFLCLVFILTILLFNTPLANNLNTLHAIYLRAASVLIWAALVSGQILFLLIKVYQAEFQKKSFWDFGIIFNIVLILVILFSCFFYWAILITQAAIFVAIEGWFWQFHAKPFWIRDGIFLLQAAAVLMSLTFIIKNPGKRTLNLILLVLLGFGLQAGFGFIEGQGFESLRLKFVESFHKGFAEYAADNPDGLIAMMDYEHIYSEDINLGTKPPGALLIYILVQKAVQVIFPSNDFTGRFLNLTQAASYLFPLIASLAVIPIYILSKWIWREDYALYPGFFYIISTNFILMPLSMDQFVMPLFFLGTLLLTSRTIQKQSFRWAVFTGIFFYFSIYFSFSLLPVIGMVIFWISIDFWMHRTQRQISGILKLLGGVFLGAVFLLIIFRIQINYDIFLRYASAFAQHRTHKGYQSDFPAMLTALVINNFEYLFWTGIPLVLLALSSTGRSLYAIIKGSARMIDGFSMALILTYIAINILGQTRSEVGRLWLYLVPALSILAAKEAGGLFRKQASGYYFVTILMLISTFLTYKFQDFYF